MFEYFPYANVIKSPNDSMCKYPVVSHFQIKKPKLGKIKCLPEVTQIGSSRVGIQFQIC